MDLSLLLRGAALGFAIAAPVGPIGVICIRRTLSDGRVVGFVSGLGAATADMTYGAVAAFGLTAIAALLVSQRLWIHLIGGLFLLYLGIRTLLAQPAATANGTASITPRKAISSGFEQTPIAAGFAAGLRRGVRRTPASRPTAHTPKSSESRPSVAPSAKWLLSAYGSTLALTLTNPATILSFVAVFAGLGVAGPRAGAASAALITLGVFTGSALWWLILSTGVNLLRARLTSTALRWVNRLSGAILIGFAVYALASAAG